MIKVTVNSRFLNARVGSPKLSAPAYQNIAPGKDIEVEEQLYPGDTFESNALWLKDAAGNYYWSGGVSGLPANLPIDGKATFGWFNSLNIAQVWQQYGTTGANVKVAILDSGYDSANTDLAKIIPADTKVVIDSSQYTDDSLVINDTSPHRHGTRCASLVGAMNSRGYVIGVAPGCELLIAKTTTDDEFMDNNYLLTAIDWAIDQGADIISASFAVNMSNLSDTDAAALNLQIQNKIGTKQILLFAAAGNVFAPPYSIDNYPACLPSFVSVGATTAIGTFATITALNSKTIIHAPGMQVESWSTGNIPTRDDGTSFSAPIVAGIAALAVSYLKNKNNNWNSADLLQKIYDNANPIAGYQGRKLINPLKLFQMLNS